MDVDGTLTDGAFYIDEGGRESKRFDVRDGLGLVMLRDAGVELAIISGRASGATDARARGLGIVHVINGCRDKLPILKGMAGEMGLTRDEVAYIGDDLPDVECIKWAGLGMAVADAEPSVIEAASWVSRREGGRGAVRDAAEHILCLNTR